MDKNLEIRPPETPHAKFGQNETEVILGGRSKHVYRNKFVKSKTDNISTKDQISWKYLIMKKMFCGC